MQSPRTSTSSSRTASARKAIIGLSALALLFGLSSVAVAGPTTQSGSGPVRSEIAESPTGWYIVLLKDPPLSRYTGGVEGLEATANSVTGATKLATESDDSLAYRAYLRQRQDAVLDVIRAGIKPDVTVYDKYRLDVVLNGFVVQLSHDEAIAVSALPEVLSVEADAHMDFVTDVGPEWIGAPAIWGVPDNESFPGAGGCTNGGSTSCGEGIVAGVIDTGINTGHPSFADVGGDGYDHTNPRGTFYGECNETTGVPYCNDKLIGAWDFSEGCVVSLGLLCDPNDDNGHGTHTSSTVAGNVLDAEITSPTLTLTRPISGVAPHANIIHYKACQTTAPVGCELTAGAVVSALVASIDQAVDDEVDVINFSIGGGPADPWDEDAVFPSISLAFLGANAAGIVPSASAGNSGPAPGTVGYPAVAPWVFTVAASTHNRKFTNGLIDMASTDVTPLDDMFGASFSCGYPQEENDPQDSPINWSTTDCPADFADALPDGRAPIVWAGDYETDPAGTEGDCGAGPPRGANLESSADPFPGVDFNGAIVVCIRGTYARVDKAVQVANHGAGGFVLINDAASGNSLVADPYSIPGVHLTYDHGQALLEWLESAPDRGVDPVPEGYSRQAAIQGTNPDETVANGDIMASFSSRGPNAAVGDILKPDITAPGVDVLAAWMSDGEDDTTEFNIISGTSMSSPHNAGAAVLMRAIHPDWSPDQIRSAMMTTAFDYLGGGDSPEVHDVYKEDGSTSGDPFDFGGGRVDLNLAANAGLIMEETEENYLAADPEADTPGEPSTLNIPSMAEDACSVSCGWDRTLEATIAGTWTASVVEPAGIELSVEPSTFTLEAGETATIRVTANVTTATPFQWHFGQVQLSPGDAGAASVGTQQVNPSLVTTQHLPVAVFVPPLPLGAPELEGPEKGGCAYDLSWTDLVADEALGLGEEDGYRVQQSTNYIVGLEDNADNMAAYWETEATITAEGESVDLPGWTESSLRSNSPPTSYWSGNSPVAGDYVATMTLLEPISVPEGASPVVQFMSFEDIEGGFDFGYVQASNDGGASWETALAVTGDPQEWMPRTAEFTGMDGDVLIRFVYVADLLVGLVDGFEGWYVDDIVVTAGTWTDVGDTEANVTTFTVRDNPTGTYFHRVAGLIESAAGVYAVGPWSNVIDVDVECILSVPTGEPSPVPTVAPTGTEGPGVTTRPSATPRVRFIPDTALGWAGTPAGLVTVGSLAILFGSLTMFAVPRIIGSKARRPKP